MFLCLQVPQPATGTVSLSAALEGHLFSAECATAIRERSHSLSALHISDIQLPLNIYLTQYDELWRSCSCMIWWEIFFWSAPTICCKRQRCHPKTICQFIVLLRLMLMFLQPAWLAYLFCQLKMSSDTGNENTSWHLDILFQFVFLSHTPPVIGWSSLLIVQMCLPVCTSILDNESEKKRKERCSSSWMFSLKSVIGSRWINPVNNQTSSVFPFFPCKTHQITIYFVGFDMPERIRGHLLAVISLENIGSICKWASVRKTWCLLGWWLQQNINPLKKKTISSLGWSQVLCVLSWCVPVQCKRSWGGLEAPHANKKRHFVKMLDGVCQLCGGLPPATLVKGHITLSECS